MATLQLKPTFMNDYETAHKILQSNPAFNEQKWLQMTRQGDLDMYIDTIYRTNSTLLNTINKEYNLDYSDEDTKFNIIYNELHKDELSKSINKRTRLKAEVQQKLDKGIRVDLNDKDNYETYDVDDYTYFKNALKDKTVRDFEIYDEQMERERIDSISDFTKSLANTAGIFGEAVNGVFKTVDGITSGIYGIGKGITAGSWKEAEKAMASDEWRFFEKLGVEDALIDFERRYTHMRDFNGNFTTFGKYAAGIANTMGMMMPAMLGGMGAGAYAKVLGAAASTVATVQKVSSTLIFYGAMTSNSVKEMYQQFAINDVSVPTGSVLANAALKSVAQVGVELLLSRFLGGTAIDNMVFGRGVSATASSSLAKAGWNRLLSDFAHEGLEEVFQDTSDFLLDKAFSALVDENFGEITDMTWESISDAFLIGGLASFAGSALKIWGPKITKSPEFKNGEVVVDKKGKTVYTRKFSLGERIDTGAVYENKKGELKAEKLSRIASWEYGLDMQSFIENFNILAEQGKQLIKIYDADSKEGKKYIAAFTEMYAAYRMIASVYHELGETRFNAANQILTSITTMIKSGKFSSSALSMAATSIYDSVIGMEGKNREATIGKLEDAMITEIADKIYRGGDITDILSEKTRSLLGKELTESAEETFKGDKDIHTIVYTKDGKTIVEAEGVLFVPIKYAGKVKGSILFETLAEQYLVQAVMQGKFKGQVLDTVLETFKKVTGRPDATLEEAVYNLIFNDSFFNIMLSTANKDMYALLSSLVQIEKDIIPNKLRDTIYKQKIAKVTEKLTNFLYQYCINQQNADYKLDIFTKEQQKKIAAARWCKNLYARVINNVTFKKLTENDWNVLTSRVNGLAIRQSEKDKLLTNLRSENKDVRIAAMNRIARAYKGIFTTNYDGTFYMPDTNVANRTFNAYLQANGLTIETVVNMDVEENIKNTIKELYGEFNQENLIKFRQSQFMQTCNNSFIFRFNKAGKIGIFEAETNKQVGYADYKAEQSEVTEGKDLDSKTVIERGSKKNYLVKQLLNDLIDAATASYLSIDDVITDPTLLSDKIQAQIQMKYGNVNQTSTFMYLREYFINKFKNTTVIVLQDGSYAFADVHAMKSSLKSENFEITNKTKITDLIKPTYLYGRLKDIKIKLTSEDIVAEYSSEENTIYINEYYAAKKDNYLTFALLHEFQHAIQVENAMNLGLNVDWINNPSISKTAKKEIIADVRKHRPELFEGITKGSKDEETVVNNFVYYSSGETAAYGIDATKLLDFYPTIVKQDGGTKITFPWGKTYNISSRLAINGQSLVSDITSMFDRIFAEALVNQTEGIDFETWRKDMRSLFITSDGQLRIFDRSRNHFDILNNITKNGTVQTAVKYFDSLPEVSIQQNGAQLFVVCRVGDSISRKSEQMLLMIMDHLYASGIDFEVGPIFDNAEPSYDMDEVLVSSRTAEDSDSLLRKYNVLQIRKRQSKLGSRDSMSLKAPDGKSEKSKRYVSQQEAKGTNLEKFGYTAKYKRTQMNPGLKKFIIGANENIANSLWESVKKGTITASEVLDYLRDSDKIDDTTFRLINDSFFQNSKIKTFAGLQEKITNSPKYYAMRAVLKASGFGEALLTNANPELFEGVMQIINKDEKLKKLFDKIESRYYTYHKQSLKISEKYLRKLWMQYYDGTVASAGYIAAIAKIAAISNWKITGETGAGRTTSLQDTVGEDMALEEVLEDTSATDAFEWAIFGENRKDKIDDIMKALTPKFAKKIKQIVASEADPKRGQLKAARYLALKREQLEEMSDKDFAKTYAKYIQNMSEEEINKLFLKNLIVETGGIDVLKLNDKGLDELETAVNQIAKKVVRPNRAVVNNIKSITRTIKANLSKKDKTRFLTDNGDIFDENLNVKKDLYQSTDDKGRIRLKDVNALLELENRVRELSKSVRANDYSSEQSLRFRKKFDRELDKLRKENERLAAKLVTGKEIKAITYEIADETITIDTDKQIPSALKRILESEFNKVVKSKTQYLTNEDAVHIQMNLKKFIEDNAEYLQVLTQSDVDSIIDFYLTSEILPSTNKARQYSAIQVYLMTYIIKGNKLGQFSLTEQQLSDLSNRLESLVSLSAANLSNWKAAMKMLKPEEILVQSLAKSSGIEFSIGDIEQLTTAIASGDAKKIIAAKDAMYENGLRLYKGRKLSFFNKLIQFERMAMLSAPGTWIRNQASNFMVEKGNKISEYAAGPITSLIEKMFPKKKWKRDNQYRIVGTKVTSEVQTFIKNQIIDTGLMDIVKDGLSKYDARKFKDVVNASEESLSEIIANSIVTKIFQQNGTKSKTLNATYNFLFKMLSDDKAINKAAIRYLGKILTEDNVDLTKGLSIDVINHLADAYTMAAEDYMHKTNFFNDIEAKLKDRWGDGAYFMYKQVLPFASASWNWFVEGLNYTPLGLAMAIRNFAKLETTIEKLDNRRRRGESVMSSRFAEYVARRNIGKGVIGTIGFAIGCALAGFGIAGIDEEDDQYKLRVGNVYIDISDIFGSQGIMLGIALISAAKGDGNILDVIGDALNTMFLDSSFADVFNSFRYSESFGDWLLEQPFDMLQMFIPNMLKTISGVANKYKIKYSSGILSKFERIAVQAIPGLAYALPFQYDPYTGQKQVMYKAQIFTQLANKLLPFKIYPYNVSETEKIAISLGVKKGELTGKYEVRGEKINLSASEITSLNEYYGKLNEKDLADFIEGRKSYKVLNDKTGKYVELKYGKMTDKQKATVIDRIMSNNSSIAKTYILTSTGKYKYYASSDEYDELKKLGITKNVYKKSDKYEGYVKIK